MLVPSCSPHDTSDPHKSQDPWFHRRTMATPSVYLLQPFSHMTNVGHVIQFLQPTFLHGHVLILACPFTDVLTQVKHRFEIFSNLFFICSSLGSRHELVFSPHHSAVETQNAAARSLVFLFWTTFDRD